MGTNQFPLIQTLNSLGLQLQQTITSSGSVTIPAGISWVFAIVIGGGGSGGSAGGGGGGVSMGWTPASSYATIGAGGAAVTGLSGNIGGTSLYGIIMGGGGGGGGGAGGLQPPTAGGLYGGAGGGGANYSYGPSPTTVYFSGAGATPYTGGILIDYNSTGYPSAGSVQFGFSTTQAVLGNSQNGWSGSGGMINNSTYFVPGTGMSSGGAGGSNNAGSASAPVPAAGYFTGGGGGSNYNVTVGGSGGSGNNGANAGGTGGTTTNTSAGGGGGYLAAGSSAGTGSTSAGGAGGSGGGGGGGSNSNASGKGGNGCVLLYY